MARSCWRWALVMAIAACGVSPSVPDSPDEPRPATGAAAPDAPTVVLISIDTLRPDHLGCYGYEPPTSPNLDRFRQGAVLFSDAIAQAPSTLPSHATMLTSLLPEHHGAFFSRRSPLPSSIPTLATVLGGAGYRTAAFTGGGQIAPEFGLDHGFEIYGVNRGGPDFADAVRAGLEWLGEAPKRPSLLFLHTYQVHHPYTPDPAVLETFDPDYGGPLPAEISRQLLESINRHEVVIDARDLAHIVAAYDAEIRAVDNAFGELLEGLAKLGLEAGSLIVFTSDHGEEFGEHGVVGWHSHTLYDELLRVPLVIRYPDGWAAGTTVSAQVRLLDLAPTVLAAVGIASPTSFEGVDLRGVVEGRQPPLAAVSQLDLPAGERRLSVRTLEWKLYPRAAFAGDPFAAAPPPLTTRARRLVARWMRPFALFDLSADPGELIDVAAMQADEVADLRRRLAALSAARPVPPTVPTVVVEPTTEERLRALGYVE